MKHSEIAVKAVPLVVSILLCCAREAYAYIDPGTGSYVIQVIIASVLGTSFAIKIFWRKIKAFILHAFWGKRKDEEDHH